MLIKFDEDVCGRFKDTAEQFIKLFGTLSIKSLMILCRQGSASMNYSDDDFDVILKDEMRNPGYKLLKTQNGGQDIPYCLWDNVRPYDGQHEAFLHCFENLRKIDRTELCFIFDMVQITLDNRIDKRERDKINRLHNEQRSRKKCILS